MGGSLPQRKRRSFNCSGERTFVDKGQQIAYAYQPFFGLLLGHLTHHLKGRAAGDISFLQSYDGVSGGSRAYRCSPANDPQNRLRINDIGIVAVNGEPFAELGLEVKRRNLRDYG